jgi:protocatechuate 3,4-dioxygenase beta subunit
MLEIEFQQGGPMSPRAHLFLLLALALPFLSVRLTAEEAARSISGQVIGPEGEPVAGASLTWIREVRRSSTTGSTFSSDSIGGSQRLGTTNADGRFRVSGPPPGPVDLYVTAEGYAPHKVEGLQLLEERDLENVKISLARGILVEVQVLDVDGAPVPDAWVYAEPEDMGLGPESPLFQSVDADTDSTGRCRLNVPKPGVYMVGAAGVMEQRVVVGPGASRVEVRLQPDRNLAPPPDRPTGGKPTLRDRIPAASEELPRRGLTLTGRILVDGRPLSRGEVDVHGESTAFGPSDVSNDGTFTVQDMPAGTSILVITNPNGFVGVHTVSLTEDQNLSIELSTGRLRGRVADATGKPVENATVSVDAWIPAIKTSVSAPSGRTGAEGTFEIPRLGAGTYKIKIKKEGFASVETTVEVPAGGDSTSVTVILKPQEGTP